MRPINQNMIDAVMQPGTASYIKGLLAHIDQARQETASADADGSKRRQYWQEVAEGQHKQEVAGAVIENVNVDVLAHLFTIGAFFEVKPLGPNDYPVVITTKRDTNYTIGYLAEDNGAPRRQRVTSRSHTNLNMTQVSTEKVEFPWRSLNTGNYDYMGEAMNEVSYELDLKIDQLGLALLKSSKKASGLRGCLNLHPSIVAENIPDANYLDLSGATYGDTGVWTVLKLQAIFDYAARFSADVERDGGGQLQVKTIFMSSRRIQDFWKFVDLVTGFSSAGTTMDPKQTVPTNIRQQIWQTGGIVQAFGNTFNLVPRNTLASDEVYVSFNKPAGRLYTKTSMDVTERDTSFEMHEKNLEALAMRKVIQLDQPSHLTKNFLVVKL